MADETRSREARTISWLTCIAVTLNSIGVFAGSFWITRELKASQEVEATVKILDSLESSIPIIKVDLKFIQQSKDQALVEFNIINDGRSIVSCDGIDVTFTQFNREVSEDNPDQFDGNNLRSRRNDNRGYIGPSQSNNISFTQFGLETWNKGYLRYSIKCYPLPNRISAIKQIANKYNIEMPETDFYRIYYGYRPVSRADIGQFSHR